MGNNGVAGSRIRDGEVGVGWRAMVPERVKVDDFLSQPLFVIVITMRITGRSHVYWNGSLRTTSSEVLMTMMSTAFVSLQKVTEIVREVRYCRCSRISFVDGKCNVDY